MVVRIKVSGFENEDVKKLTLMEEKSGLLGVSSLIFNKEMKDWADFKDLPVAA